MVKETRLYDVLDVEYTASYDDLKKGFQRAAKKAHPDRNPEGAELMKQINFAYFTLIDESKRTVYDHFGEKGLVDLENGTLSEMDYEEHERIDEKGNRQIHHFMKVRLEELYCGSLRIVNVSTYVDCDECNGQYDSCEKCNSNNKVKKLNPVYVQIPVGARNNYKLLYDLEYPNSAPVKLTVELIEQDHSTYRRRDNNLYMEITIEVVESLTFFDKVIKTLDGRMLCIYTSKGSYDTIDEGGIMVLEKEGMPHFGNPLRKGDMFITFHLNWPGTLTKQQKDAVKRAFPFPRPDPVTIPPDAREYKLEIPTDAEALTVNDEIDALGGIFSIVQFPTHST